jgi:hypothetical protein
MQGWVYVLVNSSLPGLVKVGLTTRSPDERAEELSSATGVPTPFVIAFSQFFSDCRAAEAFVHEALSQRGVRTAANREFFSGSVQEVIRVVMQAPGQLDGPTASSSEPDEDVDLLLHAGDPDPLTDLVLEDPDEAPPWADLLHEAYRHMNGDGCIQDFGEALALFKQAARLGSASALYEIGCIYELGNGVKKDKAKALEFMKQAARKDYYEAYSGMANIFAQQNHQKNFETCMSLYFDKYKNSQTNPEDFELSSWAMIDYIRNCKIFGIAPKIPPGIRFPLDLVIERADSLSMTEDEIREFFRQNIS